MWFREKVAGLRCSTQVPRVVVLNLTTCVLILPNVFFSNWIKVDKWEVFFFYSYSAYESNFIKQVLIWKKKKTGLITSTGYISEKNREENPDFYIWMSGRYCSHLKIKTDRLTCFKTLFWTAKTFKTCSRFDLLSNIWCTTTASRNSDLCPFGSL